MIDSEANRQDAIETACHNAIRAVWDEAAAARREQRTADPRLALAAALEVIERERTADLPDVAAPFTYLDVIAHLRATASPRREQPWA